MSASENLKELEELAASTRYYNEHDVDAGLQLVDVLPEIIAVVKAAEEGVDESLADEFGRLRPILDALASLDAKLTA